MRKSIHTIFLGTLFFLCTLAQAQSDEITDTLETTAGKYNDEEKRGTFSAVNYSQFVDEKKIPQQKIDKLKADDDYWYANTTPLKKEEEKPSGDSTDSSWLGSLLWILILASFIAAVIWYLASSNIGLFRRAPKSLKPEEEETEITENIFELNYEKEIGKAVEAKNYRLAVRLWYLRTLKDMADRNIINYTREKTNSDYLLTLFGGRYYRDFFRITRNFEYTWYGQFPLTEEGYRLMQNDFTQFKNSMA